MKKFLLFVFVLVFAVGCVERKPKAAPVADSGVKKVTADIKVNAKGMTTEQENIKDRYAEDNQPGAIKHLYVISAYSGQVIIYSTVRGKVTSGGKRLTSTQTLIRGDRGEWTGDFPMPAIQDDGTYGSSMNYLYWWDTKGVYHQHYVSGGQILHISNQPIAVKSIIINMELSN